MEAKVNATAAREAAEAITPASLPRCTTLSMMRMMLIVQRHGLCRRLRWPQQLVGYIARPTARVIKFADDLAFELRFVHDLGEQTPPKGATNLSQHWIPRGAHSAWR